jgi:hypothetical protein
MEEDKEMQAITVRTDVTDGDQLYTSRNLVSLQSRD